MTASEMLDHLRRGLILSRLADERELLVPVDKIEKAHAFLMSDHPLPKGREKPAVYDQMEPLEGDFEALRSALLAEIVETVNFFEEEPEFEAIHPSFGRLNGPQWLQLHRKHFQHHARQFKLEDE